VISLEEVRRRAGSKQGDMGLHSHGKLDGQMGSASLADDADIGGRRLLELSWLKASRLGVL